MNEESKVLRAEKVAVCPECYEYVILKQEFLESEGAERPVLWAGYCARCKKNVDEPKLMDISERQFLNVRAMRKAKEAQCDHI